MVYNLIEVPFETRDILLAVVGVWLLCGAYCASRAPRKGRPAAAWAVAGAVFGPIAVIALSTATDLRAEAARIQQNIQQDTQMIRMEREMREALARTPKPPLNLTLPDPLPDDAIPAEWRDRYGALRTRYEEGRKWVLQGSPSTARSSALDVEQAVEAFLQGGPPADLRSHAQDLVRSVRRVAQARRPPDFTTPPPA